MEGQVWRPVFETRKNNKTRERNNKYCNTNNKDYGRE
jgi:hypothetical protein